MTRAKLIATACFAALLGVLTLNVAAQDFNTHERTFMTFSGTVELPGITLQPGTYLFRLADSLSNRHIVQVFSQDEKQIHATILAVPAERLEVTGENVMTFREAPAGTTPAVQYWYYPGDRIGHEFVYPKDQAVQIAKRTGQTVLTAEGDVASSESTVSSMSPEGTVSEWKREGAAAPTAQAQVQGTAGVSALPQQPEPTPQPEPAVTAAPKPAPQPSAVGTAGRADELPRTASPLPLSGLIGLLSLGGALVLRRSRR